MADHTAPCLPAFPTDLELSPQFRLAAACSWIAPASQAQLQGETVAAICEAGVDWDAFLILVNLHGIPVQALTVLRRCLGEDIPQRVLAALKARNKRTAVRSFVQAAELIRLSRLLGEHAIDMLPLKGVALSQRLYATPDVRTSGDLDVLVRPENLAMADRLLSQLGYRKNYDLTERQMAALLIHDHHLEYYCEMSGQHLELHWKSRFWSRDDMEVLWRGRKTEMLMAKTVAFPNDPALFVFLCDHGSRHWWTRLKWLGDIAMMLAENGRHDWDSVTVLADQMGMRRAVAQTTLLASWLYRLPLPLPIAGLLAKEKVAAGLAKKAVLAMLRTQGKERPLFVIPRLEGFRNMIYFRRVRPSISYSQLLQYLVICPTDYTTLPLPDSLFWLYVPLRPVFWFWRHFGGKFFTGFRSQ